MPIEGELVVRIASRAGQVTDAHARSERPRPAARIFRGRAGREAAPLARSLFALCGQAQGIAAEAAVEAASGATAEADRRREREARLAAETLLEHARFFLVETPRLAGLEPCTAPFVEARRLLAPFFAPARPEPASADAVDAWSQQSLLGVPAERFLRMEALAQLEHWMRSARTPIAASCAGLLADEPALGASDVPLLPAAPQAGLGALAAAIDGDAGFDARPRWDGGARETGALARTADHPLVAAAIAAWGRGCGARLAARLVDCAQVLQALREPSAPRQGALRTAPGQALAWAETARGLLLHRVALDGERIADYRIVAPTEWNFAGDGAFVRGALALRAPDGAGLDGRVRRLLASLDPCVGVRYEARHA